MNIEIRSRTASLSVASELYLLLCDTCNVFFRGLVNLTGWDWFTCAEQDAGKVRAGPKCGFWNLEVEPLARGGFEFWGFGRYLVICRAK